MFTCSITVVASLNFLSKVSSWSRNWGIEYNEDRIMWKWLGTIFNLDSTLTYKGIPSIVRAHVPPLLVSNYYQDANKMVLSIRFERSNMPHREVDGCFK